MKSVLDAAQPLIDVVWKLRIDGQILDTPERRAAAEKDLMEQAQSIADESVRRLYIQSLKDRLFTLFRPPRTFIPGGGKRPVSGPLTALRGPDGRLPGIGRPKPPQALGGRQEKLLLSILLSHPILIEKVADQLGQTEFIDSELDKVRRGILKHANAAHSLDGEGLCALLRSDGLALHVDPLLEADEFRICRDQTDRDATVVWEHVFTLGTRHSLKTDVGRAIERLGQETSDANWTRLLAMVTSSAKSIEYNDED
jgi:DNA primase